MKKVLPDAVARRLDPAQRYGLRLTLFAVAILLVAVPFAALLLQVVSKGPLVRIDSAAANDLHGYVRGSAVTVDVLQVVSFLGKPIWTGALVAAAVGYLLVRRRLRLALFMVVTVVGGGMLDTVVKQAVSRPRPELLDPVATAYGKSFPSGHAMTSVIVYGALLLVFLPVVGRRWRPTAMAATAVLILAIGFSRLALGVHFITDVIGGYVLGSAWLAASVAAFSIWRQERGRAPVEPLGGLEPEAARQLSA